MPKHNMETILDEVVTLLRAGISAAVTALNTEIGDAYTLTAPASAAILWLSDPGEQPKGLTYPAYIIIPDSSDPRDGEPAIGGRYEMDHTLRIDVLERVQSDRQATDRRIMRHVKLITSLIATGGSALTSGSCVYAGSNWNVRDITSGGSAVRDVPSMYIVQSEQQM